MKISENYNSEHMINDTTNLNDNLCAKLFGFLLKMFNRGEADLSPHSLLPMVKSSHEGRILLQAQMILQRMQKSWPSDEACKTLGSFQLHGCEIYSSCEPCPMCLGAIYWARLERVFYGNTKQDASEIDFDDSFIYEEFLKPLTQRKLPMEQLLREEALAAFNEWKIKEGKVKY